MFKKARTLSSAFLCMALLASCDQTEPDGEGGTIDFRSTKNGDCVAAEQGGSTSFQWEGWFPDDIDPWWTHAAESANLTLVREFERSGESEICYEVCRERDLDWGGEGCVVDGGYDVGERVVLETRERWTLAQTEIYAEVALGCACQ